MAHSMPRAMVKMVTRVLCVISSAENDDFTPDITSVSPDWAASSFATRSLGESYR